jgi:death-on-curing protein
VTDYPTVIEVLEIHADQIAAFGCAEGIRDLGLIEAALYRPQTGYYDDEIAQAAALWESFAMNHPFVDGNKRVAFAVTETFLAINGIAITAESDAIHRFIIENLEGGTFRHDRIVAWLRLHTAPVDAPS